MNQNNNNFQQYGFDHYEQPPMQARGSAQKVMGPSLSERFRNPVFATAAILMAGVFLGGVVMMTTSSDSDEAAIPVVQSQTFAYKQTPTDPGGMQIANQDSTIFMSMREDTTQIGSQSVPTEDLLAGDDTPEKLEEFARQVEEVVQEQKMAEAAPEQENTEQIEDLLVNTSNTLPETVEVKAEPKTETPPVTLQKIAKKPTNSGVDIPAVNAPAPQEVAAALPVAEAGAPARTVYQAGQSPETLAFVRSVLDQKDAKAVLNADATNTTSPAPAAAGVAAIEPAAGAAMGSGTYFVQLGSVKSASGAESEWGKMQGDFGGVLSGLPHRVQEANLGERGTFYRIQAGPMSKDGANSLCDQIKAQKPGACLVTQ